MSLLTTAGDACVLSGGKDSFIPLELVSMRAWVTSGHG